MSTRVSDLVVENTLDAPTSTTTLSDINSAVSAHSSLINNPHSVTKSQVGLSNVDNTSDLDKAISNATQAALDLKYDSSNPNGYQDSTQVAASISSASILDRNRSNHTGTQLKSTISDFAHTHPLSEITQSGATTGQVPTWNGSSWVPLLPGAETILRVTATQTVASVTPTNITELTTGILETGWYEIRSYNICQSTATTTGVGIRFGQGTGVLGVVSIPWAIGQAVDGTDKNFEYYQNLATTNLFSASALAANADFSAQGNGLFQVTTQGTFSIQLRSETGTAVSIRNGSILILKKVA